MAIANFPKKPTSPTLSTPAEWRCRECGKLLGVCHGARLHVRMQGHSYLGSLPVEASCRGCGAVNRI
jgi:RNase P subunit RPR2